MTHTRSFAVDIGWRALLKDLGIRADHVLRRANLPQDLLARPGSSLTTPEYFRFWQSVEAEAGDTLFPLRVVQAITTESFVPPIFAALCSAHLWQAARRLAKYKELIAPMKLEVARATGGDLSLTPRWLEAEDEVPFSLMAAELAFLVRLARLATREPVRVLRVAMPRLPDEPEVQAYAEFFGARVVPGKLPCVTFASHDATRPFLTANEAMWQIFEPELRQRLGEVASTATTAERVHAVLLELLPSGEATIEAVAGRLALSKRTLQRRLTDERESFRTVLNRTREGLARHYLAKTDISGGEIAFLLGFEDPNSFFRAFHEWTGQTAESVRHAARLN